DAAAPVRAEIIVAEAVAVGIDDPLEPRTKGRPLGRIDLYLEYRELHALAEVRAGAGDAAQAADAAGARRRDVVAHEHHHPRFSLFPEPGRIGIQIPAQMSGEKLRLQVGHEAECRLLAEEGVLPLLSLA